ncbi:MAG: hypothetical protein AB1793_09480 [Candidatus Thermoplasmatota archaeon]
MAALEFVALPVRRAEHNRERLTLGKHMAGNRARTSMTDRAAVLLAGIAVLIWLVVMIERRFSNTALCVLASRLLGVRQQAEQRQQADSPYARKYAQATLVELKQAHRELARTLNEFWTTEGPLLMADGVYTSSFCGERVPVQLSQDDPFTHVRVTSGDPAKVVRVVKLPRDAEEYQWLWELWEECSWLWKRIAEEEALAEGEFSNVQPPNRTACLVPMVPAGGPTGMNKEE